MYELILPCISCWANLIDYIIVAITKKCQPSLVAVCSGVCS